MDAGGDLTNAIIGELMLAQMVKRQVAGIVINGAIRALRQERIKQVRDPLQPVVEANRPARGASTAVGSPVTVAAYLDFSSPDCGQAAQVL